MSDWTSPGDPQPAAPPYAEGPPYAMRATAAPRPGIIPLRPLGVGELLDGAFTAMRRHPGATLGLAAVVATLQQVVGLVVDLTTGDVAAPNAGGFPVFGTVAGLLVGILNAILSAILLGMLTLVVYDAAIGHAVSVQSVWARIRPLVPRLLVAAFLAAVLPFLGLIALIVGGVILWVALSFTTPALVLEDLTVREALRRSWRLAMPAFWRVLGVRLLAMLIAGVIATILSLPGLIAAVSSFRGSLGSTDTGHLSVGAEIAVRLSSLVASTVAAPITAGVLALLYLDRRMRAEALDETLVQAAEHQQA